MHSALAGSDMDMVRASRRRILLGPTADAHYCQPGFFAYGDENQDNPSKSNDSFW